MDKPDKPYPDFPLFAHANGQWAKKIRGKLEYFGTWGDPDGARDKYLRDVVYLQAGRVPPDERPTLADLLDSFCDDKERLKDEGEITARSYDEYEKVCHVIAKTLTKHRPVETIGFDDLGKLRAALSRGKSGRKLSPVSVKRWLSIARMVFNFGNEELGHSVRYKKALRSPSARSLRLARRERMFQAAEIRKLVKKAKPQMKAMILLGINCGFGNNDCGTLPIEAVDLESGWHRYARPKTGMDRRCPLWPETIAALEAALRGRTTKPLAKGVDRLLFVTKYGNPWTGDGRRDPIGYEFRKLGPSESIYSLRRTFETIAPTSGVPQWIIDAIMGHVPDAGDMAAVYRQKVHDNMLRQCVDHVRMWYLGKVKID
jgi:integrase